MPISDILVRPYRALVIDDLRVLPDRPGVEYVYARNLDEAFRALRDCPYDEMWFDHDLGGDETIRPFVTLLEERINLDEKSPGMITDVCYILTDNPVGGHWLQLALEPHWTTHVYHGEWTIRKDWIGR